VSKWDTETAEWYAERYGEYATNRLGLVGLGLEPDFTVVDIGCGTGSALRHASEQISQGFLIGIDPVPRMIEIAREKTAEHPAAARITFFEGSAEKLPIEDGSADIVLAFDSYDHWQDQKKGLREVRRVLKPNGRLVVVKDGGLPDGDDSKVDFLAGLSEAGFNAVREKHMDEDDVSLHQWVCVSES
jgi:SAM-dependent methyltransferase